jgi:hypothetical protein
MRRQDLARIGGRHRSVEQGPEFRAGVRIVPDHRLRPSSVRSRRSMAKRRRTRHLQASWRRLVMTAPQIDDKTRTELEAAAFRRLVEHLRERTDVQNIDMMNLAGFCRNCLSRWYREAAEGQGIGLADPDAREIVYGMPYKEWQAKYQKEANGDQKAAFTKANPGH